MQELQEELDKRKKAREPPKPKTRKVPELNQQQKEAELLKKQQEEERLKNYVNPIKAANSNIRPTKAKKPKEIS